MCYKLGVVSLRQHRGHSRGKRAIVKVTGSGEETLLSIVRPCGMGVLPNGILNMSGSPHLTISYLLLRIFS